MVLRFLLVLVRRCLSTIYVYPWRCDGFECRHQRSGFCSGNSWFFLLVEMLKLNEIDSILIHEKNGIFFVPCVISFLPHSEAEARRVMNHRTPFETMMSKEHDEWWQHILENAVTEKQGSLYKTHCFWWHLGPKQKFLYKMHFFWDDFWGCIWTRFLTMIWFL